MQGGAGMILYFVFFIAIFYFLIIKPQKKREKETRSMLDALKVGDEIITIGGIIGKITRIKDDIVVIETGSNGDKNLLKFERSAIKTVTKESTKKQEIIEASEEETNEEK